MCVFTCSVSPYFTLFSNAVLSIWQIRNGEQKSYVLKNKELTGPTKGVIYLEIDVIYNTVSVSVSCLRVNKYIYTCVLVFCSILRHFLLLLHHI